MKTLISKLLIALILLPTISFGQSPVETQIKNVEQGLLPGILVKGDPSWNIVERMKFYKIPGLSIAVIKDFKIDWAKGYGVKDLQTNEPVTTDTLFQAGSISKSVNAVVAMKKVEQGKIALDDNINNKLISWKLPDNEFTARKKVSLRNLLSHTAGTTVHGFPGYAIDEKVPTLPQVLDGTSPANTAAVRVDFEPGSRFRYSGGGTTIAQLAIMDIEKKPYPDIARETVLGPLNMTNSTYSQPLPADWRKKAATGYRPDGNEVAGKIHVYPEMAAAGLWTTPSDLAKFAIELQLSLAGKSNKVLKKETVDLMTTGVLEDVGLGFFVEKHGAAIYFGHGGADEGFRAEMLVNRDKGYGVVVMANSDNGNILREVVRGVAREYKWDDFVPTPYEIASVDADKLSGYTGRFRVNLDQVLTITLSRATEKDPVNRLFAQPTGARQFELLPISPTTFIRRDANIKYEFGSGAASAGANGNGGPSRSGPEALRILVGKDANTALAISSDELVPFEMLMAGKLAEAIEAYRAIKKAEPDSEIVSEGRLNGLGYTLVAREKLADAIALFKLNVEFYPNAWNTYDSLGEAYLRNGDKELAILNYKKSLELNPGNGSAAAALKKLQ
ncbi:MAG TPA: serine hydrolase [Pyrinomonadaceae bacterium]|nr:serine hydrolase [Pyrinomonadaceae bacterium]